MREGLTGDQLIATIFVIYFAIGLHEYAHAKFADMAGDPTPRMMGRVTLQLWKHFDPLGAIMILITALSGIGIGWGKPVMVDPRRMRSPRVDHFVSVVAGPLTNFAQAVVYGLSLRVAVAAGLEHSGLIFDVLFLGILINLSLCFFNLIPLGPLDGHWLVGAFLRGKTQTRYYLFQRRYGGMMLIAFILLDQLQIGHFSLISTLIGQPTEACFRLIMGR